eukprot:PhF_6_TR16086/c0_g1_i1/m.25154
MLGPSASISEEHSIATVDLSTQPWLSLSISRTPSHTKSRMITFQEFSISVVSSTLKLDFIESVSPTVGFTQTRTESPESKAFIVFSRTTTDPLQSTEREGKSPSHSIENHLTST